MNSQKYTQLIYTLSKVLTNVFFIKNFITLMIVLGNAFSKKSYIWERYPFLPQCNTSFNLSPKQNKNVGLILLSEISTILIVAFAQDYTIFLYKT